GPRVCVLILRLELVSEQGLEHAVALPLVELLDADRVTRIAVEHSAPRDRMREKERMDGRRTPPALLGGERRPQAAGTGAHVLPELVEVVGRRRAFEARLELGRQILVRGLRVGEHRGSEHLTVAPWHLDRVEHVQKADGLVVGHVGVPVLPGVGDADRLAVLDDVREIADLGHPRLVVTAGQGSLDPTEALREVSELGRLELLSGEVEHAVPAEGFQNCRKGRVAQRLREVRPPDGRPQHLPARLDARPRPRSRHAPLLTAGRDYTAPGSLARLYALQAVAGLAPSGRDATEKRRPAWRSTPPSFAKSTSP